MKKFFALLFLLIGFSPISALPQEELTGTGADFTVTLTALVCDVPAALERIHPAERNDWHKGRVVLADGTKLSLCWIQDDEGIVHILDETGHHIDLPLELFHTSKPTGSQI